MGGNLSTLPEDELIKAIEDPNSPGELNQEHVAFHRSTCLNERTAKLRTQIGDQPLDDITKREMLFKYHPDSKLFCVYGKNKYGINGALLSQEEEDKHREIWCEHHDCAPEPPSTPGVLTPGVPGRGTPSNDASVMMMSIISSLSMFFIIMFMMIILLKKRRHNY